MTECIFLFPGRLVYNRGGGGAYNWNFTVINCGVFNWQNDYYTTTE